MLSLELQSRLAHLLLQVADLERQVEITRQVLCELIDFEPYSAFRTIDRFSTGALTSRDIEEFLLSQGIPCSAFESSSLVKQYDSNSDGRLSLPEFHNLVLPAANAARRDIVLTRTPLSTATAEVRYAMGRLMEREVIYQREVSQCRRELAGQRDFNPMEAFKAVNYREKVGIDKEMLRTFLLRCGHNPLEDDLHAIIRRLDTDGDEKLSYLEFLDSISARDQSSGLGISPLPQFRSPNRRSTPLRSSPSPSKHSQPRTFSPLKAASSLRRSSPLPNSSFKTPEKRKFEGSSLANRSSAGRSFPRSTKVSFSPLPAQEETELVNTLKQQMDMLRDLEDAKSGLVDLQDFNLIDGFRVLDVENKGFVACMELEEGLRVLGVRPLGDECYLLIRSYSKLSDSRLRFSDFSSMLTPKDAHLASALSQREPYRSTLRDPRDAFSSETLQRFAQVLRLLLDCESLSERLRQRLSRRPEFSSYDAFQAIDRDRNGFITLEELREVMEEKGCKVSSRDLKCLMERYDKNRDGRVSYSEFVQEVTPKSPRKH